MSTINVIAPYRYHGMWVFDDPRVGLVQEPCINGADSLIDSAVASILGADRGFFLIFSGQPFPGHVFRLIWRRSDMDGNWYAESLDHEAWLCPGLLKFFDDVPKTLYLQCKAKPIAQVRRRQPEHVVSDRYVTHLNELGAPAWARGAVVLVLFLIVTGNLILATIGLLGGSRPRGYVIFFLAWSMGITGLVMLARLWHAMVLQRAPPPSEPPT